MAWAFGLNAKLGAGCLVFVFIYIGALVPFYLHYRKDTPETRARLPYAYMAVIFGLLFQALWIPIFMIASKESLGEKYMKRVRLANNIGASVDNEVLDAE